MINEALSAILQIIVFAFLPFLVYLIQNRTYKGFFEYIGLKKSNRKANVTALLIALLIALPVLAFSWMDPDFKSILTDPSSITGRFKEKGFSLEAVFLVLIIALFKTALSEEIFFRGFLAKRLIAWLGYRVGNVIQALIFGIMHALLFALVSNNALFLFIIFLFPAMGAYLMVYCNEKLANGSIVPGWIAHATGNVISYSVVGFLM